MLYIIIITLIIYNGALLNLSSLFNSIDEVTLLFLFISIFINIFIKKKEIKLYKYEKISFIYLMVFFVIGNISSYYSKVQNDYIFCFSSGILTIKSIICYYFVRVSMYDNKITPRMLLGYDKFLEVILWIYFIIALANVKFDFLDGLGLRNGIETISIGFNHPATLEFFVVSIMIIKLFIKSELRLSLRSYYVNLVQCLILILFAGRTKGIAFVVLFILCFILVIKVKKFNIKYILLFTPLIIYISLNRIKVSLLTSNEARNVLYRTAFKISNDYFPLGSGFATFGSDFSRLRYSPLYYKYYINNIWGLSQEKSSFITDTQWASLLAETGYIGIVMYIVVILLILLVVLNISNCGIKKFTISSILIYGLIASISDSILVSFRGTAIFFILAFFISIEQNMMKNTKMDRYDKI